MPQSHSTTSHEPGAEKPRAAQDVRQGERHGVIVILAVSLIAAGVALAAMAGGWIG